MPFHLGLDNLAACVTNTGTSHRPDRLGTGQFGGRRHPSGNRMRRQGGPALGRGQYPEMGFTDRRPHAPDRDFVRPAGGTLRHIGILGMRPEGGVARIVERLLPHGGCVAPDGALYHGFVPDTARPVQCRSSGSCPAAMRCRKDRNDTPRRTDRRHLGDPVRLNGSAKRSLQTVNEQHTPRNRAQRCRLCMVLPMQRRFFRTPDSTFNTSRPPVPKGKKQCLIL